MARRLVLHIGSMKSGTSYLQDLMSRHRGVLREHGVDFAADRWKRQVSAVLELIDHGGPRQSPLPPDGAWHHLVGCVEEWPETSVVSMEFLGPRGRAKIDLILDSFPETEVEVVMTARDLTRQLPAMWQEAVQNRSEATWDDYVASARRRDTGPGPGRNFWRQQAVDEVAARWSEAVGRDRFTLVTVPPPGAPPEVLWQRFAQVLGVPAGCLDPRAQRSNPSIGPASALVMRALNAQLAPAELSRDDYMTVVKGLLAKRGLVHRDEPKLRVREPWLRAAAREQVDALAAMDLRVVGDLADLLPRDVPGVRSREITSEMQLAAAVDGLAFLLRRHVEDRAELGRLRRDVRRLRRALEAASSTEGVVAGSPAAGEGR